MLGSKPKTQMQQLKENVCRMIGMIRPLFIADMKISVIVRHPDLHMQEAYFIFTEDDQTTLAELLLRDEAKRKAENILKVKPDVS